MKVNPVLYIITLSALLLSVIQIARGAEVREKIDAIASRLQEGYRSEWVNDAGNVFLQHRDLATVVLLINVVLYVLVRRGFGRHSIHQQIMSFTFLMLILQIVTGILLSYLSLPPMAQAAHILLASLIFGAQFYLLLNLSRSVKMQEVRK